MVSQQALNEFKQLYKEEYGIILDNQKAMELAERLLGLFRAIYRPIKPNNRCNYGYETKPKQTK